MATRPAIPSTGGRSQLNVWLDEPVDVKRLANNAFVGGLAALLIAPSLPETVSGLLFWVALVGGLASVSHLVFAPDKDWRSVSLGTLPLVLLVHLVITLASVRQEFYVKFLSEGSFGDAVRTSLSFVLLEWGAAAAYGRSLSEAELQPLRRRAVAIPALGLLCLAVVASVLGPCLRSTGVWSWLGAAASGVPTEVGSGGDSRWPGPTRRSGIRLKGSGAVESCDGCQTHIGKMGTCGRSRLRAST